jgi:large subunit ribosomal protein L25
VECLATQLPEFISVDLSGLTKGKSLHVSDLKFPAGIKAVRHGTQNPVVVSVAEPKVNAEDAAAEAAAAEAAAAAAAAAPKGKGGKAAPAKTAAAAPAAAAKKK